MQMSSRRITKRIQEERRIKKRGRLRKKWLKQLEEIENKRGKTKEEMRILSVNQAKRKKWLKDTENS